MPLSVNRIIFAISTPVFGLLRIYLLNSIHGGESVKYFAQFMALMLIFIELLNLTVDTSQKKNEIIAFYFYPILFAGIIVGLVEVSGKLIVLISISIILDQLAVVNISHTSEPKKWALQLIRVVVLMAQYFSPNLLPLANIFYCVLIDHKRWGGVTLNWKLFLFNSCTAIGGRIKEWFFFFSAGIFLESAVFFNFYLYCKVIQNVSAALYSYGRFDIKNNLFFKKFRNIFLSSFLVIVIGAFLGGNNVLFSPVLLLYENMLAQFILFGNVALFKFVRMNNIVLALIYASIFISDFHLEITPLKLNLMLLLGILIMYIPLISSVRLFGGNNANG